MAAGEGRLGVFGYGSLVAPESAAMTLGRPLPAARPARLRGWRRRWSLGRDNLSCEKTFELADGRRPEWVLGLNLERGEDPAGPVNGVVIELREAELERLDLREIRYDRVEVSGLVEGGRDEPGGRDQGGELPERILAYTAKARHFLPEPPADAVILASYAELVESAFAVLGPGELEAFRATTGPHPVERAAATLVVDRIPEGNPREW